MTMSIPSSGGSGRIVIRKLYRDCLRLIQHVAPGSSPKSMALRMTVRAEFKRNLSLRDEDAIEAAKSNAVRALSNYLLARAAPNDAKLHTAVKDYHNRSVGEANSVDKENKTKVADNSININVRET